MPTKLFISLRNKFIILFALLITIPFIISGLITYYQYSSNVEEDSRRYTRQIIEQVNINLDQYMRDMDRITMAPYYNQNVMSILRKHPWQSAPSFVTSDEYSKMNLMISSLTFDRSEIRGVLIFARDRNLFSNLETTVDRYWNALHSPWMAQVEQGNGSIVVVPPHDANYYLDGHEQVISIARVIREISTNDYLGIVKVDLTEQGFKSLLDSTNNNSKSQIYISDRKGEVIYPIDQGDPNHSLSTQVINNEAEQISVTVYSEFTGMQVTGLIPKSEVTAGARELVRSTVIVSVISMLVAYLLAIVASSRLVKPIRHLQKKMKKVQKGDFGERAEITSHDEIGHLTGGFNIMVAEIERLIKEVYESKLREKEAELSALESQINPHFIYNTLESINMMALESNQHQLSSVVVSLGRLLRFTVNKEERFVFLKDELMFVESYIQILSYRLGGQLQMELDVDLGHEDYLVPKLILQPLIENVIEHALDEDSVTVRITTAIEEDQFLIIVSDDGKGMNEERMEQVEAHMYKESKEHGARDGFGFKKKGFALRNVHWRIRLLFGPEYGLFLDRTHEKGTHFVVKIPLQWKGE
ncbi:sensor histidine kinase [Paenibacillus filicis]|uniref:Sensor histidine kinase n=1 Tax=Paenibacillus filicis TaxID=669464 RepID=A0ABU9DHH5_9BACL